MNSYSIQDPQTFKSIMTTITQQYQPIDPTCSELYPVFHFFNYLATAEEDELLSAYAGTTIAKPMWEYLHFTYNDMSNPEIMASVSDTMVFHFEKLDEIQMNSRYPNIFQQHQQE